jgi:hypothetical protein
MLHECCGRGRQKTSQLTMSRSCPAHTHTHTHIHARAHARANTHTHTPRRVFRTHTGTRHAACCAVAAGLGEEDKRLVSESFSIFSSCPFSYTADLVLRIFFSPCSSDFVLCIGFFPPASGLVGDAIPSFIVTKKQ